VTPIIQAEALFVSPLQPSEHPTRAQVSAAIRATLSSHGGRRGCVAALAREYGEHPDAAAARMSWAITLVSPQVLAAAA
jgi:hypothetical protein